jgi:pilus assembly protein CpaE
MAQLVGLIVSQDDAFRKQIGQQLRSGAMPISVMDDRTARDGVLADIIIVDVRGQTPGCMAAIELLRAGAPAAGLFAVAAAEDPGLILQSMRAGANEFFTFPPPDSDFHEAIRRAASRRQTSTSATKSNTMVFFGAKGGAGTTTLAVNCAVEVARLTKRPTIIVDLKAGLGEITLFLGVRSRYTLIDALDNLHRLDAEFLKELVVKHKSGLEILAGSELFDRPSAADAGALEEVLRLLARQYEYIVVDAGTQINPCSVAAMYTAETICFVANPDVPSVRNAQRLLDRIGQLGSCRERVRLLLNRAAEPYPIPPAQIEATLGHPIHHTFPSDYKTVSTALNSGVPVALTGNSAIAEQFDRFTRRVIDPSAEPQTVAAGGNFKLSTLGFDRLASIW